MSLRYKGAVISATPPTTTGGNTGTASGAWTLQQQMQAQAAGNWPSPPPVPYIEDVFSTYLYSGTGSSITNHTTGVNLKDYGGMLWIKMRNNYAGAGTSTGHVLFSTDLPNADVVNDGYGGLSTNSTSAYWARTNYLREFLTTGFKNGTYDETNGTGGTFASWTFRKQKKFFDVVTYTGNGTAGRTVAHNLGSTPGFIIVKRTNNTGSWACYHRSIGNTAAIQLNYANTPDVYTGYWNDTSPTSSNFTLGNFAEVNGNGDSFVAYLFAHDAGGFGENLDQNVISCGSCAGNATVNLGYEPQWILMKRTNATGSWILVDNMRGMVVDGGAGGDAYLLADTSGAEVTAASMIDPSATGFTMQRSSADTYIYIAIRRGPMKTPTTGTSVFSPVLRAGTGTSATITSGFVTDLFLARSTSGTATGFRDRLRGANNYLRCPRTDAEATGSGTSLALNTGVTVTTEVNGTGENWINYQFQRAPGFFDEVCYTGTGSARTVTHNLGVAPELMIVKCRSSSGYQWSTYVSSLGNTKQIYLNLTDAAATSSTVWNNTSPTSSVFTVGTSIGVNESSQTYVAYLFATVAGVSKVGSYTGTGTTQQINCGFTGGARFVMIKRTDSTGDWYVWDSARGIVSGNDPYFLMNDENPETTGTDYVDTYAAGFEITSTAPSGINANGGSFIFLAIA